MLRFLSFAIPTLLLIMALFGVAVDVLDLEPRTGAVLRLSGGAANVPAIVVLGGWIMEVCGLLALFLLAQGRCGNRWLDGLVAGWLAWVFRGPIFVVTIVVATRQPQDPWWRLAFAWWILYSLCGLALAALAPATEDDTVAGEGEHPEPTSEPAAEALDPGPTEDDVEGDPEAETDGATSDVPELPLEPGDEDPTDRHPTVELLQQEMLAESDATGADAGDDRADDEDADRADGEAPETGR